MKVLLVYPTIFTGGRGAISPMPPLTVFHLAALARDAGHDVEVLEPSRFTRCLADRELLSQWLAGVDLLAVSGTSVNWCEGRRFLETAREIDPELPVVAGGVHASRFDERLLNGGGADYVVCGEGERGWIELLSRLDRRGSADLDGVPGLSARDAGGKVVRQPPAARLTGEELGELALPAYDLVPEGTYNILPFETSRGCFYSCAFCSITHQRGWRAPRPERVYERLAQVLEEHGSRFSASTVCFVDDCFTAGVEHVQGICGSLRRAGVRRPFMVEARVTDLLRGEVLEALLQIELAEIQIGVECGYDEGLKKIRKGLKVEMVRACAERLSKAGVARQSLFSLILGLPWEGPEECRKTLDFGAELSTRWGGTVNFSWWIPLPSELWDRRKEWSIEADDGMFDRLGWAGDADVFWKTHPRLSPQIVTDLRQAANAHRRNGAMIFGV